MQCRDRCGGGTGQRTIGIGIVIGIDMVIGTDIVVNEELAVQ